MIQRLNLSALLLIVSLFPCFSQNLLSNPSELKKASANGKYDNLLQIVGCPADVNVYGDFYDWGYWSGNFWCNQTTKPGYWVWSNPKWYIWSSLSSTTIPDDKYQIVFFAYGAGKEFKDENGAVIDKSKAGHIFVGFYINGKRQQVKGLSPSLHGKLDESTNESHLIRYHDEKFKRTVSQNEYYKAIEIPIKREEWTLGWKDCVSYADEVADSIGLITPLLGTDPLDFSWPILYLRYLKRNNSEN